MGGVDTDVVAGVVVDNGIVVRVVDVGVGIGIGVGVVDLGVSVDVGVGVDDEPVKLEDETLRLTGAGLETDGVSVLTPDPVTEIFKLVGVALVDVGCGSADEVDGGLSFVLI